MDQTTLVHPDLDEGRKVLDAAKDAGISILLAGWAYFSEPQEWRLVLVTTPSAQSQGPRAAYTALQKALGTRTRIPLRQIVLTSPNERLGKLMAAAGPMGKPFGGGQVSLAGAQDVIVDTRYLYQ